jgi:hypothetical protein
MILFFYFKEKGKKKRRSSNHLIFVFIRHTVLNVLIKNYLKLDFLKRNKISFFISCDIRKTEII